MSLLTRLLTPRTLVHAHCDVPCGIYDPSGAQVAAKTVKAMTDKFLAVEGDDNAARNTKIRMVLVKEEHAQKVKDEVLILWTDYFKAPHEEAHPGLTGKIKATCNLASRCKQTMDAAAADELIAAVEEIAEIFWATKKA